LTSAGWQGAECRLPSLYPC